MTGAYNITGQERIDYIDLIRAVKEATGAKTRIQTIPYNLFWALLKINAIFDRNPAFTVGQLEALVTPDVFEVIDWPSPSSTCVQRRFRKPSIKPFATRSTPTSRWTSDAQLRRRKNIKIIAPR